MNRSWVLVFVILVLTFGAVPGVYAQTTAFTYQGKLTDGSVPTNGTYPMQFDLFAAPTGGTPVATDSKSVSSLKGKAAANTRSPNRLSQTAAALNALREQNTKMLEQLKRQQLVIDELRQIVCTIKPDAAVCKERNK